MTLNGGYVCVQSGFTDVNLLCILKRQKGRLSLLLQAKTALWSMAMFCSVVGKLSK